MKRNEVEEIESKCRYNRFRLLLKSEKFKSELNGLQGQANQASTKISGALKGIGKAALAAFSVAAVVKFGKACLQVATETKQCMDRIKFYIDWAREKFFSSSKIH